VRIEEKARAYTRKTLREHKKKTARTQEKTCAYTRKTSRMHKKTLICDANY